jgi:hypothetical protein
VEIKFKTKDATESRVVNYDLPDSVEGLVEKFGSENVFEFAKSAIVIALQALARRHIEKSDEEIQALVDAYDPNTRAAPVKQSPEERAKSAISKLTPEQKAALLAQLQGG